MNDSLHITLSDGRRLSYCEVGAPEGRPVLHCHGGLSCRTEVLFADELCREVGVRLIVPDRPGIGQSDFSRRQQLVDWTQDMEALVGALDIGDFAVMGWSAGGPYALACAAQLSNRVTRVATLAGMAPLRGARDIRELGLWGDRVLFSLSPSLPHVAGALLSITRLCPRRVLAYLVFQAAAAAGSWDATYLEDHETGALADTYRESLLQGGYGTAWDYRLLAKNWGFALESVTPKVHVWHGAKDKFLLPSHGERLAAALPHARLHPVAEHGHFLLQRCLRDVLAVLI